MKLTIEITCDNEAFEGYKWSAEVHRMLNNIIQKISWMNKDLASHHLKGCGHNLFDDNGNTVCNIRVS